MNEPLVLIHGLFQMLQDLPARQRFATRAVLVPDLPGYGEHRAMDIKSVSVAAAADSVREQIRQAGHEKVHILGHSIGGAVAVALVHRYPETVASFIDVEGNFTLKDAFWSAKVAAMSGREVEAMLEGYCADVAGWLTGIGIEPTADRVAMATRGLKAQPASTVQAMARSVVEVTAKPSYLESVREILDRATVVHLVAGERSREGWDVPEFVLKRAASMTIQPAVGHMMMLENPVAFLDLIDSLIS